jgi:hypothetical protein
MKIDISNFEWKSLKNQPQDIIHCLQNPAGIQGWHPCNSNSVEKNPI